MNIENKENSAYLCTAEWHLARLVHTPLAGVLYGFARQLSKNNKGRFYASQKNLGHYFDVSRWTIKRTMEALVESGFFELVAQEPFTPSVYRVISHKEWLAQHPGCCAVKETFPWSTEDGDQLGRRLCSASGGKVRYQTYQLAGLRATGLSDEQIVAAFERLIAAEEARRKVGRGHGRWGDVQAQFCRWLTGRVQREELEALGLEAFRAPAESAKAV